MNKEKVNSLYLIILFSGLGLFVLYGISNEIRILKNPNYNASTKYIILHNTFRKMFNGALQYNLIFYYQMNLRSYIH